MKMYCAWCINEYDNHARSTVAYKNGFKWIYIGSDEFNSMDYDEKKVSHGMCPEHYENMTSELRKRR